MRLRRETGDFQIRINPSNGTNAIRTGLSAEDFAGELININGTIEPVLSVSENEGVVTAKTASYTVTYNKETGAIASSEGGAGGSGGETGSGFVIECTYEDLGDEVSDLVFEDDAALPADLAGADLVNNTTLVIHRNMVGYEPDIAVGRVVAVNTNLEAEAPKRRGLLTLTVCPQDGGYSFLNGSVDFFYDPEDGSLINNNTVSNYPKS